MGVCDTVHLMTSNDGEVRQRLRSRKEFAQHVDLEKRVRDWEDQNLHLFKDEYSWDVLRSLGEATSKHEENRRSANRKTGGGQIRDVGMYSGDLSQMYNLVAVKNPKDNAMWVNIYPDMLDEIAGWAGVTPKELRDLVVVVNHRSEESGTLEETWWLLMESDGAQFGSTISVHGCVATSERVIVASKYLRRKVN